MATSRACLAPEELRLAGGVRVLLLPIPGSSAATLAVWWRTGSRYETAETQGAHHLLEHLLVDSPRSGDDGLTDYVESCGGEASAFTSKEHLVCFCRVPGQAACPAAARLAKGFCHPRLGHEEFEFERGVVRQELLQAAADPADRIFDIVNARLFPSDGLGAPTGGRVEDIEHLTLADVESLHRQRLHAGTVGVVAVGAVDGGELLATLGGGPLSGLRAAGWRPEEAPTERHAFREFNTPPPSKGNAHVVIGAVGPGYGEPELTALEVANELLGGGSSSDLVETLRNEHGLCYELWSHYVAYRGVGQWRVYFATRPDSASRAIDLATSVIEERLRDGWTSERVAKARRRVAGRLLMMTESSLELALWLGEQRFSADKPHASLRAHIQALEQVEPSHVLAAARRLLKGGLHSVVTGS